AHRRALECDGGGAAGLSLQDHHSDCRRARDAAGGRRDGALRRLPADRSMAEPAQGRRGNRRGRGAARAQRICRRGVAQGCDRAGAADRRSRAPTRDGRRAEHMTDPALGLLMLGLIVVVIMMGFPTAFTLMGLGIFFGFIAFYFPGGSCVHTRVFYLIVPLTYHTISTA